MDDKLKNWIIKQNIIKNLTVLAVSFVLLLWAEAFIKDLDVSGLDIFFFLGIFPLGAMFAYFAFSYSATNLNSTSHRALADIATFIFLVIISFSVGFSTLIGAMSVPQLKWPFLMLAVLLIAGAIIYDFWNLYSNLENDK